MASKFRYNGLRELSEISPIDNTYVFDVKTEYVTVKFVDISRRKKGSQKPQKF